MSATIAIGRRTCARLFMLGLLALVTIGAAGDDAAPSPSAPAVPVLIRVNGPIDDWLFSYLQRKLDYAEKLRCDFLVLEIDSPGGGLTETLALCDRLTALKNTRTVAYIPREGLSGAALLALACNEIVVGADARVGDCGPIYLAEDFLFRHAPEKIRSDLIQRARLLADKQGHAPALAEAMVDMNTPVLRVRHRSSGEEKLVTGREANDLNDDWERRETLPESGDGRFLTLTGERAVAVKLAQRTINTRDELLAHYRLTLPPIELAPNLVDRSLYVLNHWATTVLLLLVGLAALGFELSAPGLGVGGVVASLCFALFFWSRFLGGTADWLELILFLLGVLFLLVEIFVLPGFGVAGVSGLLLVVSSLVLATVDFVLPANNVQLWQVSQSLLSVLATLLGSMAVVVMLLRQAGVLPLFSKLILKPPRPITQELQAQHPTRAPLGNDHVDTASTDSPNTSSAALVPGTLGTAVTLLRPGGKAQFGELVIDVVTNGSFIEIGRPIRIVSIHGMRIVVTADE